MELVSTRNQHFLGIRSYPSKLFFGSESKNDTETLDDPFLGNIRLTRRALETRVEKLSDVEGRW
jgi:hypothetical protein